MAHIYLASPHMSEEGYEQQYVKEAFDTNWIAPLGKNVNEFEKELAAYVSEGCSGIIRRLCSPASGTESSRSQSRRYCILPGSDFLSNCQSHCL